MSISITPPISTAGAVVGQNLGPIKLTGVQSPVSPALDESRLIDYIVLYNESQCGLLVTMSPSGRSFRVPAGAWTPPIPVTVQGSQDNSVGLQVEYVLNNPLVMQVGVDYFYPGEPVIVSHTLGNSPIGGSLTAVSTTLSNEGNPVGSTVIDMGTVANPDLVKILNDGSFTWSVEQAGTPHTILQGKTAGNPLLIGQAGDVAEALGKLQVDQGISQIGGINSSGPFGVPFYGTVTTPTGVPIAVTTATTIHTVTRSAQGVFRATMLADINGTVNTVTFTLTWTDPVGGAITTHFQSSTANAFTYINALAVVPGGFIGGIPITFVASAGTTSSLIYQNSSGVPADHVWAFIEQLA